VDVTGFVYHDPRQDNQHFYVARFSVTCCVADAAAVGLEVNWPDGRLVQDNTWVRVQGSLAEKKVNGQSTPFIQATKVDSVPAPEQPYLFQ
jgi:putative membrane protein